ncbi:hypothetical protein JOC78_000736 [Bacillus ectoiniformans]|nr:hypothetical protein [Bacillus ectoiniformans]MBM7647796.1 hypothetical protein [Bacillus ectoiniformans]
MTKKFNKGSKNQSSPARGTTEFASEITAGDNSKGVKRNKDQNAKTR